MMKIALSLSLVLTFAFAITPSVAGAQQPPTQVSARLWRSGRPTEQSLRALWNQGVRVIVDLEDDATAVPAEAQIAKRLGFVFYSYPTNSFFEPDDAKIKEILQIIQRSPEPVVVHCFHGEDRTGLVIGLYRVFQEGWAPEKAYDEMLNRGFHPLLLGLDLYFREQVGSFFL